jgi:Arc/MetJ-type ribon-helix-helix transcriptional regulator
MEITLSPEIAALVASGVASGRYRSAEEYVGCAVELLHLRELPLEAGESDLRASLEVAWEESERGELMDEDEVRREMQAMKAEFFARKPAA